jgi:hypothetical protein
MHVLPIEYNQRIIIYCKLIDVIIYKFIAINEKLLPFNYLKHTINN